jgi:hypothetical protein
MADRPMPSGLWGHARWRLTGGLGAGIRVVPAQEGHEKGAEAHRVAGRR